MTLAGFDGFRIHMSDQSFLFFGDGSEDGKLGPSTLCVLTHKDKEVSNALKGAGIQSSDAEIVQEVAAMSRTNMYRPAADAVERTRERPLLEDVSWQSAQKRSRKQCQAKNPNCNLERGTSILSGTVEGLDCDICCSEPGFCRECCMALKILIIIHDQHHSLDALFWASVDSSRQIVFIRKMQQSSVRNNLLMSCLEH